jgi:hypothetical protein
MEAFTYGEGQLNPALIPGGSRRVPHRTVSPYHVDYEQENDLEDDEMDPDGVVHGHQVTESDDDDDEDEPLSTLVARRHPSSSLVGEERRRLVRRGSEGFEVKPAPSWRVTPPPDIRDDGHTADGWLLEGSEGSDGWD